jgi:membrane fusion protein (multidrug efflux system)
MVSNIESMRFQFFLTEADYLVLIKEVENDRPDEDIENAESRQSGNFELILADGTTYQYKGDFDFIDRNVDVSTGSIMIQTLFPNTDNRLLRPGMFAKVRVKFETVPNAILVPQRSIMELQGQYSVYVVDSDGTVKARSVAAAERIGDLWLISEGLEATDVVVLEGIQKVRSDMKINPVLTEFQSQTNQQ